MARQTTSHRAMAPVRTAAFGMTYTARPTVMVGDIRNVFVLETPGRDYGAPEHCSLPRNNK